VTGMTGNEHLDRRLDAIIIGAGPAGTAAAAILAERGRRVRILEKEAFPRYRVGESLIPYCWFPLDRLGLVEQLDDSAFVVRKHSVQFVGTDGRRTTPFYFQEHTDHDCARTWQVKRPDFDEMMLRNALDRGAEIARETTARALIHEGDRVVGVRVDGDGGTTDLHAPITIDASGRDLFAVSRQGWRVPDTALKKIAVWTYYQGARRDCGRDEGATTIAYLPEKGWFWYIPLPDDMVSVGVVAERDYLYRGERDPDAIFAREVTAQPWIAGRLAGGRKIETCRVTGDYSYRSRYCATDGLVLVGDAFAFLDPVFSSGVFLALQSGVMAGDAVAGALDAGDTSAARFTEYGERLCRSLEAMRRLVYTFYDTSFSFGRFLKAHPEFRDDVTDVLIGNLERDLDPMFEAASRFADIPKPLAHGRPLV